MDISNPMQTPRFLTGLEAIAGDYDAFILDLWGVLHDGHSAFPHTRESLLRLKALGRKTLLLSNAPRRSASLIAQMEGFGLERSLYGDVLSSGEATWQALHERSTPFFAALGEACYFLGPERDLSVIEDTPFRRVERLEEAAFIVNTGPLTFEDSVQDYAALLQKAAGLGLPMVCANPDHLVIRQGRTVVCAGALAAHYEALGGPVTYLGQTDPAIFRLAVARLGVAANRVCMVGDGLETDMLGAKQAGLAGLWVTGGLFADAVDGGYGKPCNPDKARALIAYHAVSPVAVIPGFIWETLAA